MSVSGGVASFPQNAGSQDELVQLARAALGDARAAGGGRISAHEPDGHHVPQPHTPEPCAPRADSAGARATSEYAGLLAGELGLDADRIVRAEISESALPNVRIGQMVQLAAEADPTKVVQGKVLRRAGVCGAR